MNRFKLTSNTRNVLFAMIALGVICLVAIFFKSDDLNTRFWSNILINSTFFTGISFMTMFVYAAHTVGFAGFYTVFKRVWEAFFSFLAIGLIFIVVIALGNYFGFHSLYLWADKSIVETDVILQGKVGFLNPTWYLFGSLIIAGSWVLVARKIRTLSIEEDNSGTINFNHHIKMRNWASGLLPLIGFGSAALIWLWVMSLDAHWYSTLFAWYTSVSWAVAAFCLTILLIIWLKYKGYFENITTEHLHDLGKYVFAFSIFWAYMWFSQYMLIWFGNIGEETGYFKHRIENYPILFYGNFIINFAVPFIVLMRNDTKRKYGTLIFTTVVVFFGHWLDTFLMITPGVLLTSQEVQGIDPHVVEQSSSFVSGFTMPGLLEIGVFVGFLGLFLVVVLNALTKAALTPLKDPYLEESLHHEV